jgi:integrase
VLHRRGNSFVSRIVVPADLQGAIGRQEITRSLRTGDRREAIRRLPLWESHVRTYLSLVRKHHATMTRAQLDALTRRYLERSLDEIEEQLALEWDEVGLEVHQDDLIDQARQLSARLARADYAPFLPEAQAVLPGADEVLVRRLARRFMEAKLKVLEAGIRAINGEPLRVESMDHLAPNATAAPAVEPDGTRPASPTLSAVVAQYSESKVATNNWSARSAEHYADMYGTIVELLGDPPIASVTKDDIRRLGLSLTNFPKNAKKVFPGTSAREALARAADSPSVAKLSPRSVNAYQQAVRSVFRWAHDHDLIATNPATVLKDVKTRGTARDERHPFTDAEIRAYFDRLREDLPREPWLYWIPAIMAYTGCRLGEAAQLRKSDIRLEGEIWVLDINGDHPDKRLKTDYSRRLVPVHSRLIELGVLELQPSTSDGFLWPAQTRLAKNPEDSPVDRLQKKLATRLKSAGIKHDRKTGAHSFRHTVTARLKSASVPDYQIAEILGHKNDSITTGRYGTVTDLERLRQVIELLNLPV